MVVKKIFILPFILVGLSACTTTSDTLNKIDISILNECSKPTLVEEDLSSLNTGKVEERELVAGYMETKLNHVHCYKATSSFIESFNSIRQQITDIEK